MRKNHVYYMLQFGAILIAILGAGGISFGLLERKLSSWFIVGSMFLLLLGLIFFRPEK